MSAILHIREDSAVPCALTATDIEGLLNFVLEQEGVSRPCDISLSFVDDETIATLNAQWRGKDEPTDVLSLECETPAELDEEEIPGDIPCSLGDIVLDPAYIAEQAARFGVSAEDETRLLLIHGLLHLLGYDHEEDAEAQVMEAREDELLRDVTGGRLTSAEIVRHGSEDGSAES